MDEPFSALDVLTAENLRGELVELWDSGQFPTQAIVLVTHSIEEAVLLADRILVLDSRPGTIRTELAVTLPRPRLRDTKDFEALVDAVYAVMTGRERGTTTPTAVPRRTLANTPLPPAGVDGLSGLAEILAQHPEQIDLGDLADELGLEVKHLLPLVDALELLGFATADARGVVLTDTGVEFAAADVQTSKQLFAAASDHVPLVRTIVTSLHRTQDGTLRAGFFRDLLAHDYTDEQIATQLGVATDWGRYAELYSYDTLSEEYQLDPAQRVTAP